MIKSGPRALPVVGWTLLCCALCAGTAGAAEAPKPAVRDDLLPKALAGPLKGAEEIVFAARNVGTDPHWYANIGYWSEDETKMMYGPAGGRLCKLNLRTGKVIDLLSDPLGGFRDPKIHYDGKRIIFSYRKGESKQYHLYEINIDGSGLRQLTDGPFDDFEPAYLPNNEIVFISTRCKRWVSCWFTQVATLHRCDGDGKNIRSISGNIEHDNTPAVMGDGRVLYTRWEYIDRSQVEFHHLWTANPDGTNVQTWFGNMHPGIVMIDSKPIPNSKKIASIFSPGHGRTEHVGPLYVVSADGGPDATEEAEAVLGCPRDVRDPYPLSEKMFIVARRKEILLVDAASAAYQVIYTDKQEVHEPAVVRSQAREPVVPDHADTRAAMGRMVLADVNHGRNMEGIKPGEIKKLLILEALPKPINFSGGPDPLSWLGTFNLERVLGTVPVEADGSAYFEMPPNRSLIFVALDDKDLSVKRMQSFVSVMPGETTSCVGCHEQRREAPIPRSDLDALRRKPSKIAAFTGLPDVIDYPRDVQPILNKHCVSCHNYQKPDGGIILTGDHGYEFSHSYWALFSSRQIADGGNGYGNRAPRTIGSSASALMEKISGKHYEVKLDPRDWRIIWMWLETSATYSGTYASLGCGMVGHAFPPIPRTDAKDVKSRPALALQKRCSECHAAPEDAAAFPKKIQLPASSGPKPPGSAAHARVIRPNDPLIRRSSQILFNLSRPEQSIALLAPLAKDHGGWGTCAAKSGKAVFKTAEDEDYRQLLATIVRNKDALDQIKRFDMPGFNPRPEYIREMKRFGILPASFTLGKDPIDFYATDQAYWKSLWWTPTPAAP